MRTPSIAALAVLSVLQVDSGQIAGRVVDAVTRDPVAGARVILSAPLETSTPSMAVPRERVADAEGRFVFEPLAPGQYQIRVERTGFAPFGDAPDASVIDVGSGQLTPIEVPLTRAAIVSGRVLDDADRPLARIMVSALRQMIAPSGEAVARTAQMTFTNDAGEFLLVDLPAGDYVVIAAPPPRAFARPTAVTAPALMPTYFPGVLSKDEARVITLAPGQEIGGADFKMTSLPTYRVSGTVVDQSGSPVSRATVMLVLDPQHSGSAAPASVMTDENGAFVVAGVVAGIYLVNVGLSTGVVGGVGVAAPMSAPVQVTVGSDDVTGLRIVSPIRR
jgi:hypothetical protein